MGRVGEGWSWDQDHGYNGDSCTENSLFVQYFYIMALVPEFCFSFDTRSDCIAHIDSKLSDSSVRCPRPRIAGVPPYWAVSSGIFR